MKKHLPSRRRPADPLRFVKKIYFTGEEHRAIELAAAKARQSFSSWAAEILLESAQKELQPPVKK